jgi:hypothetical protein
MLVSTHDGGVDHHVFIVVVARQHFEDTVENTALGPSAEPLMYRLPVTKSLRQVTPRTASSIAIKHRFDEQAIIFCGATHMAFTARQKIFDPVPLVIT